MGGLENGLVNLINATPPERYRHAVLALDKVTEFSQRITQAGVPILCLNRKPGLDWASYMRAWKVIRELKPAIVHTRNLPGLEYVIPTFCAGVRVRIHGEHGRDVFDQYGTDGRINFFRKLLSPFVHHYTTVSADLANWLATELAIPQTRITQICNGVDLQRFCPRVGRRGDVGPPSFWNPDCFIVGTVGRMEPVKNQILLVRAFLHALSHSETVRDRLRLAMIGEGTQREQCRHLLQAAGVEHLTWVPGAIGGVADFLRNLDLFVLPSLAEGISNTILEAMASGVPVVATRVGGNPELVEDGITGTLTASQDVGGLARAILKYATDPALAQRQGSAGRRRVERRFSLDVMVDGYLNTYDRILNRHKRYCSLEPAVGGNRFGIPPAREVE